MFTRRASAAVATSGVRGCASKAAKGKVGYVSQVIGAVVDVHFADGVPPVLAALDVADELGGVVVMINNAGLAVYGPAGSYTPDDIDRIIDTNVKGVIHGSQCAYLVMKTQRSGRIFNISSTAGKMHLPNESVYNASKWAVTGFTGTLAMEARAYNVQVSNICPGGIATPFWKSQEFLPFPDKYDPERDFMQPAQVARMIVELACTSPELVASEVTLQPMLF